MAYSILLIYLIVLNVISFSLMGADKRRAVQKRRRVPEQRLFLLSAIGGAAGTMLGMKTWRHKTKHRTFTVGIPFLLSFNLILILLALWFIGISANY
ncbi:DUF1294 domain-containing protein [Paenibacillus sp. N4]|uniref:DUF1294 domain-containing protein n=1 Tax=Paenibacillus vietnamensis TaxID=2590547 RepID=UPI001CD17012|nr:DUF1294 domain-containing protein [Paenibacillus vietnamensis]MCA0754147.1 DUF1294 domain-containing protein [Paenibacillus vietnamensis]